MKMKRKKNSKKILLEINDTDESKIIKGRTEKYVISNLLDKTFSPKVTQAVIFSNDTYDKDMISVVNKN